MAAAQMAHDDNLASNGGPSTIKEDVIDPSRVICDAHHHLWNLPQQRYLLPEFLEDVKSGHNVRSSVFVEWRSHYRTEGPEHMRPVGEVEFAHAVALDASRLGIQLCAAIVGFADLRRGSLAEPVLAAEVAAGGGLLRGIRNVASWDADPEVLGGSAPVHPGLYLDAEFREGFALLSRFGLSFDAFLYQTQLSDLVDLANAFPQQPIVLNHLGGVLGVGRYAGRRDEIFAAWRKAIRRVAACPSIVMKLGGLGMKRSGIGFYRRQPLPSSDELAAAWRPWIETCIEAFGPSRCMFESNFPVDRESCSYLALWNAFKRLTCDYSEAEKTQLFSKTAESFYRIESKAD